MEVVFSRRIPDLTYNDGPYIFEAETQNNTIRKTERLLSVCPNQNSVNDSQTVRLDSAE